MGVQGNRVQLMLFRSAGIPAETHPPGLAFLETLPSFREESVGCVLTDVRMPGLDGLELLRRLKEGGFRRPVVVMTAHGDVSTAVRAMRAGAVDFVETPFDDEALLAAAAARLARREPAFRYQRQLMSGGTCEATAFTAFGYQTGALAIPLGNYHNVDPQGRLAAEYVSPRDLANLALLLREALRPAPDPQAPLRDRLARRARRAARQLQATADAG